MVEADFAELIDHDRRLRQQWIPQGSIEQRCLAAAEKARKKRDWCARQDP
jgi:hypothetical protein